MHSGQTPQRGGCLSLYLIATVIFSGIAFFLFLSISTDPRLRAAAPAWYGPSGILIVLAFGIFAYLTWNWKRRGLYGLFVMMVVSNVFQLALGIGDPTRNIVALFVQPLILYLLVRNKLNEFT